MAADFQSGSGGSNAMRATAGAGMASTHASTGGSPSTLTPVGSCRIDDTGADVWTSRNSARPVAIRPLPPSVRWASTGSNRCATSRTAVAEIRSVDWAYETAIRQSSSSRAPSSMSSRPSSSATDSPSAAPDSTADSVASHAACSAGSEVPMPPRGSRRLKLMPIGASDRPSR